ncbi:MAG TPA: glycosyltransferase family 87 protein [Anaerolineae bacterium]
MDGIRTRLGLPREAGLIVLMFLAFRLMMLITLRPEHLTFFGDYQYYFDLARLSDRGLWPYLHYWMEYPPIFPFLSTVVYRLTASGGYNVYVLAIGAIGTLFGAGNLIVLMRLAARMHGEATAARLGWVYSLLFVPLVIGWWQFEAITAFCILFALDRLLDRRDVSSAIATGLGVMVKLVPVLILPAVALARPIRKTILYAVLVALIVVLIAAPLLAAAPDTARASFMSPLGWSSWETVWALIDGNLRTGALGGIDIHLDKAQATTPVGNPSRVPDWLKAIVFGVGYMVLVWRLRSASGDANYKTIGILAITYVAFLLWSKGWSPQWQVILFPLILLMMPDRLGIGFVLVFGLVNLAEWPVLISRGLWQAVPATILLRTLLLIVLLIELVRRCQRMGYQRTGKRISGWATDVS